MDALALVLEPAGIVRQVLFDGTECAAPVGVAFAELWGEEAPSPPRFLETIRETGMANDWRLASQRADVAARVYTFSGTTAGAGMVVLGGATRDDLLCLLAGLLDADVALIGPLRGRVLNLLVQEARMIPQAELLDELSRLNNEVVTSHREELRQKAALVRVNQEKDTLLGIVAHDLRNPIAALALSATALQSGAVGPVTERQRALIGRMERTARFMASLVDELLDLAVLDSGQVKLERREIELRRLVEDAVELQRVLAQRKDIRIAVSAPDSVPIVGDAQKLGQVLGNLLDNATKFSPRGSQLQLTVEVAEREVHVIVQDQGSGIPDADLGKLFKAFGRARTEATEGERSTGLGLAICMRIVEAHGGRIWVETGAGGSSFHFVLPRSDRAGVDLRG